MASQQQRFALEGTNGPGRVECLGLKFANDEERRGYFRDRLREKLQDPEFRKIEGFPKGLDEDILALSDPPYYTACPNPFLEEYRQHVEQRRAPGSRPYHRTPYPASLEDTRNNAFVNAHSYATKVPHEAVMRLLLHYTEPGDLVLDSFVGTGMTAVAGQLCGDVTAVEGLGYTVSRTGQEITDRKVQTVGKIGQRHVMAGDLCPAATHLAYNFNFPFEQGAFEEEIDSIIRVVEKDCGWMYRTKHTNGADGTIIGTLWSDVFVCGNCNKELVFWDAAVNLALGRIDNNVTCPSCNASAKKEDMQRAWTTVFDSSLNTTIRQFKQIPVVIVYEVGGQRYEKAPDADDLRIIREAGEAENPWQFPIDRMPLGEESRRNDPLGLTHIHHFFTRRNLRVLACAWHAAKSSRAKFMLTSLMYKSSVLCAPLMSNYFAARQGKARGGWIGKERSGTLYCPSIHSEVSVLSQIATRRESVKITAASKMHPIITTASATAIALPDNSIDYVFTDPPFGSNRMYSELNFLWESWLRVFTDNKLEAIENKAQGKGLKEYESLMVRCFREYHRVLKPGRWITIEFSNTSAAVWNAIQNAIGTAGFVVADVRDLDKQQNAILGYTTTTASRRDLAISAYKPDARLEQTFRLEAGNERGAWEFIRAHLRNLPVFIEKGGKSELIAERQRHVLFDRMVAFHVQRGIAVPISASDFHAGLDSQFCERDGMYFLADQVTEYDRTRAQVQEVEQLELFVNNEKSAIQWVRRHLSQRPMTIQDLNPEYMSEAQRVWSRHEQPIDLRVILQDNFIEDEGTAQPAMKGHWRLPDPKNEKDLEQLRNQRLLKEFTAVSESRGRLRKVRSEALRAGFKDCWQKKQFATIVQVGRRLPDAVIQEDPDLLMYYDNAVIHLEG